MMWALYEATVCLYNVRTCKALQRTKNTLRVHAPAARAGSSLLAHHIPSLLLAAMRVSLVGFRSC